MDVVKRWVAEINCAICGLSRGLAIVAWAIHVAGGFVVLTQHVHATGAGVANKGGGGRRRKCWPVKHL